MVRLDRVESLILQRIGAHLVRQSDPAAFLIEVEQNAIPFLTHLRQRGPELGAAVAFEAPHQVAGKAGRMKPRQHGAGAVRATDLDGVMFLPAVFGPEHMQAARFGDFHRQACVHDRVQQAALAQMGQDLRKAQPGEAFRVRQALLRLQPEDQRRRQQARGFDELQRRAMQAGVTLAQGLERPFQGRAQVIGRIGDALHPGRGRVSRQGDPRHVAIVGPCLQRRGTAPRHGEDRLTPQSQNRCKAFARQRFRSQHKIGGPVIYDERHTHAQVGARACKLFCCIWREAHGA